MATPATEDQTENHSAFMTMAPFLLAIMLQPIQLANAALCSGPIPTSSVL